MSEQNSDSLYTLENVLEAFGELRKGDKGIEDLTSKIVEKIFNNNLDEKNTEEFKNDVRKVTAAYYLMKEKFSEKERNSGERYFEHLIAVAKITLELPNPSIDKVLIALYHDAIEDTDAEFGDIKFVSSDFKIALAVEALSKKDWKEYSENEKKGKELRNADYFSHLESFEKMSEYVKELAEEKGYTLSKKELKEITQNIFDVKFADRIHNLSTEWDINNIDKVKRKIEETKKYFLPIAKKVNITAYNKMKSNILKLEIQLSSHNQKIMDIIDDE